MQTSNLLVTCVCRTSNRGGPWPAFCFLSSYSVMTCPSQIPCPRLTIACRERVDRQEVQINNASSVSVTAPRRGALEKPLLHPGLMQMKRCWHLLFFHCVDCLLGWRSGRRGRSWQGGVYFSCWRIINFGSQREGCGGLSSEMVTNYSSYLFMCMPLLPAKGGVYFSISLTLGCPCDLL